MAARGRGETGGRGATARRTTEPVAVPEVPVARAGRRRSADARHSVAAAKNQIGGAVVVPGRLLGVVPYERSFAAVVQPGGRDV